VNIVIAPPLPAPNPPVFDRKDNMRSRTVDQKVKDAPTMIVTIGDALEDSSARGHPVLIPEGGHLTVPCKIMRYAFFRSTSIQCARGTWATRGSV